MKTKLKAGIICGIAVSAHGCKTMAPVAAIDKAKNEVVFVTTSDSRSAIPELAKDKGVRDARAALLTRFKANPNDVEATIDLARLAYVADRFQEAEGWAKRALRTDTKNQEARKILAMVALQRGQLDLSEVFLNSLGGFQSKDSAVLNLVGQLRLARGNNLEAADAFKRSLEINPSDVATRMNLGVLYLKHRQYNLAGVQFERVLVIMPKHDDAKIHLAMVDAYRGKYEAAIASLKDSLSRNPTSELILFNLASVERDAGKLDDAKDHLTQFLKVSKNKSEETELVAAMLEDIQRQQASDGRKVSDSEIVKLAAKLKPSKSNSRPESNEVPVELLDETKPQKAISSPQEQRELNEVQALERELQ